MRRNTSINFLFAGHACVDIYQGAVAALVPFFVSERAYTYAAASGLILAASLLSSIAQPLFGALTDRWAMPWLLPLATVLGGAGVALSGLSHSYGSTLLVAISGIGVAADRPAAAERIVPADLRKDHWSEDQATYLFTPSPPAPYPCRLPPPAVEPAGGAPTAHLLPRRQPCHDCRPALPQ